MNTIKHWLVSLGLWLVKTFSEPMPELPELPEDELLTLAKKVTAQIQKNWPDSEGEFKRAKAYAQLTNTFPQRAKREISRAIEDAVCSFS